MKYIPDDELISTRPVYVHLERMTPTSFHLVIAELGEVHLVLESARRITLRGQDEKREAAK